eukprot:3430027-Rhodomonas_salina.1
MRHEAWCCSARHTGLHYSVASGECDCKRQCSSVLLPLRILEAVVTVAAMVDDLEVNLEFREEVKGAFSVEFPNSFPSVEPVPGPAADVQR